MGFLRAFRSPMRIALSVAMVGLVGACQEDVAPAPTPSGTPGDGGGTDARGVESEAATDASEARASTPQFSPSPGTYTASQYVYIASDTPHASIWYTTDGSLPLAGLSPLYRGPILVDSPRTIRALSTASGWLDSEVVSARYDIVDPSPVAAPVLSPRGGTYTTSVSVTILSSVTGATIYYTTNGDAPTAESSIYAGPVLIAGTTTLRAVAHAVGRPNSEIASATYTIAASKDVTPSPTISPSGGVFPSPVHVTLSGPSGASILYTTDGTTPSFATGRGQRYTAPFSMAGTGTVIAVAELPSLLPSKATYAAFQIRQAGGVAPAVVSPTSGSFSDRVLVQVSSASAGARLCYRTDGNPAACQANDGVCASGSLEFPGLGFWLDGNAIGQSSIRVSAVACLTELPPQTTPTEQTYEFVAARPVLTPSGGDTEPGTSVSIASATPDSWIRYTIDGTDPACDRGTLIAAALPASAPLGPVYFGKSPEIDRTYEVRSLSCKVGYSPSSIVRQVYTTRMKTPSLRTGLGGETLESGGVVERLGRTLVLTNNMASANGTLCYTMASGLTPECDATGGCSFPAIAALFDGISGDTAPLPLLAPADPTGQVTFRGRACRDGWGPSGLLDLAFQYRFPRPTLAPAPGSVLSRPTAVSVAIAAGSATPERIRYSLSRDFPPTCDGVIANGSPVYESERNPFASGTVWTSPALVEPAGWVGVVLCPEWPDSSRAEERHFAPSPFVEATYLAADQASPVVLSHVDDLYHTDLIPGTIAMSSTAVPRSPSQGVICYTLDGSVPDCDPGTVLPVCTRGTTYDTDTRVPSRIASSGTTLQAIACARGLQKSPRSSHTYQFAVSRIVPTMPPGTTEAGPSLPPGSTISLDSMTHEPGAAASLAYTFAVDGAVPTDPVCGAESTELGSNRLQGASVPNQFVVEPPAGAVALTIKVRGCKAGFAPSPILNLGPFVDFSGVAAALLSKGSQSSSAPITDIVVSHGRLGGGVICATANGSEPLCDRTTDTCLVSGPLSNPEQTTLANGASFSVVRTSTVRVRACSAGQQSVVTQASYRIDLPRVAFRHGTGLTEPFNVDSGAAPCDPQTGAGCYPTRTIRVEVTDTVGSVPLHICHTRSGSAPLVTDTCTSGSPDTLCELAAPQSEPLDPTGDYPSGSIIPDPDPHVRGVTVAGLHSSTTLAATACVTSPIVLPSGGGAPRAAAGTGSVSIRTVPFTGYSRTPLQTGSVADVLTDLERFELFSVGNPDAPPAGSVAVTYDATNLYLTWSHGALANLTTTAHAYVGSSSQLGTVVPDSSPTTTGTLSLFPMGPGGARFHVVVEGTDSLGSLSTWDGASFRPTAIRMLPVHRSWDTESAFVHVSVPWSLLGDVRHFVLAAAVHEAGLGDTWVFPRPKGDGSPFERAIPVAEMFDRGSIYPPTGPRAAGYRYAGASQSNGLSANVPNRVYGSVNWLKSQWDPVFGRVMGRLGCATDTSSPSRALVAGPLPGADNALFIVMRGTERPDVSVIFTDSVPGGFQSMLGDAAGPYSLELQSESVRVRGDNPQGRDVAYVFATGELALPSGTALFAGNVSGYRCFVGSAP